MLSAAKRYDSVGAKEYFREHLEKGDYYSEDGRAPSEWFGDLGTEFGLSGAVDGVAMEQLLEGHAPNGTKLFQRKITTREIKKKGSDGILREAVARRISATDFVFSAPKSVSIAALVGGDQRLIQAHDEAVRATMKELEQCAEARVRKGLLSSTNAVRKTRNIVAAMFRHHESRALDPQLHTHALVMNTTWDPIEKKYKALQNGGMFENFPLLTAQYRNHLAGKLISLGYEVEPARFGWRLKGFDLEMENLFSSRGKEISRLAKEFELKSGKQVKATQLHKMATRSRLRKEKGLTASQIHIAQLAKLSHQQQEQLVKYVRDVKARKGSISTPALEVSTVEKAQALIRYHVEIELQQNTWVSESLILAKALNDAAGAVNFEDLRTALDEPKYIRRDGFVAAREERNREVQLVAAVKLQNAGYPRLIDTADLRLDGLHSDDHVKAVSRIAASRDGIQALVGPPGAGKTVSLKAIFRSLKPTMQVQTIFLAPTGTATETLRKDGFSSATTLQRFLQRGDQSIGLIRGGLVVLDEAGAVSTRDLLKLFGIAKAAGARILLVGDTRQHGPVNAGDALRVLKTYANISTAELKNVGRQKTELYRLAVQAWTEKNYSGSFEFLDKMGVIQELDSDSKRYRAVAKNYVEALSRLESAIVIAPTWREIDSVTDAIRTEARKRNLLGPVDVQVDSRRSLNMRELEKDYARNFETGFLLSFHKSVVLSNGQFKQGTLWRVARSDHDSNLVTLKNGKTELSINPRTLNRSFDLVEERQIPIAPGDRLMLRENYTPDRNQKLLNGQMVEVASVASDGTIDLKKGGRLGPEFRSFVHGYAMTSVASQSGTWTKAFLTAGKMSGPAISREMFNVSLSRGVKEIQIYLEDRKHFMEAVKSKTHARGMVLDDAAKRLAKRWRTEMTLGHVRKEMSGFISDNFLRIRRTIERLRIQPQDPFLAREKRREKHRVRSERSITTH